MGLLDRLRGKTTSARSVVHIGFHKTGTTSIQHFLKTHRPKLAEHGIAFYEGKHIDNNHVELHVAAMRTNRISPFKMHSRLQVNEEYRDEVYQRVQDFAVTNPDRILLFSAEGISLLRHHDEIKRLRSLLPEPIKIVAYLRHPREYLASYTAQLQKMNIAPEWMDEDSHAYVASGTWLTDYDGRLSAFRRVFGHGRVATIDYDLEVGRKGSVIPSFLEAIGCRHLFVEDDWIGINLNRREPTATQTGIRSQSRP